ncbi:MAG: hypothetical protein O3C60_03815 [Planctomycetota bacterium]|nr:hypothetical protein [Planctomycetota bacterium]
MRLLLIVLMFILMESHTAWAVDQDTPPEKHDGEHILFLGAQPRLICLQVNVDGVSWNSHVRGEIEEFFGQLDTDRNSQLSLAEADQVRQLAGAERLTLTRAQLEAFDQAPADGWLSIQEFAKLVETHVCQPFRLRTDEDRTREEMSLLERLDRDANGRLSLAEQTESVSDLFRADYDEDEAISLAELQPLDNPLLAVRAATTETAGELPFVRVETNRSPQEWQQQMTQRYGEATANASSTVACNIFQSLCPEAGQYDVNHDGFLQEDELLTACQHIQPCAVIRIDLPFHKNSAAQAVVLWQHKTIRSRVPRLPTSVLRWGLDGVPLEIEARANRVQISDVRAFYLQRYVVADKDKNEQLNAEEFAGLELGPIDLSSVDIDGSGTVERPELQEFLQRLSFGLRTQMILTVNTESKSLFALLDRDLDRRVTHSELHNMTAQLREVDRNGDGTIDTNELSGRYRLKVSMGNPPLFLQEMAGRMGRDRSAPVIRELTQGPTWFRKMDRNRDGNTSWSEFLGSQQQFQAIDVDKNGVISASEAEQVK